MINKLLVIDQFNVSMEYKMHELVATLTDNCGDIFLVAGHKFADVHVLCAWAKT